MQDTSFLKGMVLAAVFISDGDRPLLTHHQCVVSNACSTVSPEHWNQTLSHPPNLCSASSSGWTGALVRRWQGTNSNMEQPPLDHHYLVLHLGGNKRVTRTGLHSAVTAEAEAGALTLVPAGSKYFWHTEGPIGFAHLYLHPHAIERVVTEEFDRDPRSVEVIDCVASRLPLLSAMMSGMLDQLETPTFASRLVLDTLLHGLIVHLVAKCSTLSAQGSAALHAISPRRLRRVLDFIEANFSADIALEDLASVAGSSRYHFSRTFRDATGIPPYRYLVQRRVNAAKPLLLEDILSIAEIADQCGFNSQAQFASMFRRVFGTSPGRFRREH